jgi:hypothetical protein
LVVAGAKTDGGHGGYQGVDVLLHERGVGGPWCTNRIRNSPGRSIPESMPTKRSRVHPNYKTKYRVGNWPSYDAVG